MVSDPMIQRRSSYGAASPVVGERGARTRQAIIDAALVCFDEAGFHATSVDDIARAVGLSRAALYQYFESKEQLFLELVNESGTAMLRVVRRLGPLGPDQTGFDNLHWWLGEWAWVHDKYSSMFVQWANVDSPDAPVRPLIAEFIENCTRRLSNRIAVAGVIDIDPADASVALLATLVRVNYYRTTAAARGVPDDVVLDTLATFVQMALFPSTPPRELLGVLSSGSSRPQRQPRQRSRRPVRRSQEHPQEVPERHPEMHATARKLLDAGSTVFAAQGFPATSVDDIVAKAALGRGTFYNHFRDKLHLLRLLGEECLVALDELIAQFPDSIADDGGAALRDWLVQVVAFHQRFAGVFRVWVDREPRDPTFDRLAAEAGELMLSTFDGALAGVERVFPLDVEVASLILLALLERVPDYAVGTAYEMSSEQAVEIMAVLIERGLLGRVARPPGSSVKRTGRTRTASA